MSDWQTTHLWKELLEEARRYSEPETETICALLTLVMPRVEEILRSAGTAPSAFTLHDDRHSFRVAERMTEIVGDIFLKELTSYEVSLLLLSAYLHDIGMTPHLGIVHSHHTYILNGDSTCLSEDDITQLTKWTMLRGVNLPLVASGKELSSADLKYAELLTAHYCRFRHNDWSESWIRESFSHYSNMFGSYPHWIDDLVALCRSHHYGYDELCKKCFDPIHIPPLGRVVHKRFLVLCQNQKYGLA